MAHNLSRRQHDVLVTIKKLAKKRKYMPSVRELAAELKLSPATTQQHLAALIKKGYIETDGSAHGLRLLDGRSAGSSAAQKRAAELRESDALSGPQSEAMTSPASRGTAPGRPGAPLARGHQHGSSTSPPNMALPQFAEMEPVVYVPLVGTIAAGQPLEAVEAIEQTIPVSAGMARPGDYLLRVSGSSMIEDGIYDGDFVVIHPQSVVENGQIAVALLEDGSATLKRIYREKDRIRLQPANSTMAPIYVDRLEIQGRLMGLVRRY